MSWLCKLLAPWRSELFALVGVLAVCGIGAAAIGSVYIGRQNDTIKTLTAANQQWSKNWQVMSAVRKLEQENALLLQDKLDMIAADSAKDSERLKQLEASNAEIKEYMSRPIPPELRRLLNGK